MTIVLYSRQVKAGTWSHNTSYESLGWQVSEIYHLRTSKVLLASKNMYMWNAKNYMYLTDFFSMCQFHGNIENDISSESSRREEYKNQLFYVIEGILKGQKHVHV